MPSLAQGMEAGSGPDSLAYWLQPFKKYFERQGHLANEGLAQADQGAQQMRGGDLGGLAVKPDELLDWDRPLSEQPEGVRKALTPFAGKHDDHSIVTGGELVRGGDSALMEDKSAQLKAAGIKGIRYKDAGSRGAEGGTYNYVIFDDKLVEILKRYGVAITAGAGGAAIVSGQDMPPEVAAQLGPDT